MRKTLTTLTIGDPGDRGGGDGGRRHLRARRRARPRRCATRSTLSITAPASVKAGKSITVTGAEPQAPAHTVNATLQYRLSTVKKWINGRTTNLSSGRLLAQVEGAGQEGQVQDPRARHALRLVQYLGGQDGHRQVELDPGRERPGRPLPEGPAALPERGAPPALPRLRRRRRPASGAVHASAAEPAQPPYGACERTHMASVSCRSPQARPVCARLSHCPPRVLTLKSHRMKH